ncbi:MAG: T9SS type A sorting domain-containing protein, partial [Flavobacteriales bacterium]|nr:T9SS type A sorting domain-containing protein [Flavobacteriales bacterium]
AKFQISNNGGIGNSKAFKLNNYKDVSNADLFTNDFWYNNRLGLSVDELITPSFDFRYTTGINVSFQYALATNATNTDDVTESLKVYSSRDCGKTWSLRKTIPATQIVTAGFAGNIDFVPTNDNQYKEVNFNYIPTSADSKTLFKFVFEASDISSNLFIDNINVTGTLSLTSDVISVMDLNVFPNPTSNGKAINISYQGQDEAVTFTLRNAQGKEISSETIEATSTSVERTLNGTENLSAACYFLEVSSGGHSTIRKVVVL